MIAKILQPMCPALLLVGTLCLGVPGRAQSPEAVVAGFEQRVDAVFRACAGKPLKRETKNPPPAPGRGNYVRAYSFSMVEFAARCFYLGEMLSLTNLSIRPTRVNQRSKLAQNQQPSCSAALGSPSSICEISCVTSVSYAAAYPASLVIMTLLAQIVIAIMQ